MRGGLDLTFFHFHVYMLYACMWKHVDTKGWFWDSFSTPSTLFNQLDSVNQTQGLLICLLLIISSLQGTQSSEAGITDSLPVPETVRWVSSDQTQMETPPQP